MDDKPVHSPMKQAFNIMTSNQSETNTSYLNIAELEALKNKSIKRLATFVHLHRSLESKTYYLNTILLSKQDINSIYLNPSNIQKYNKRAKQFYFLGYFLSSLMEITNLNDFSRQFLNVINLYENLNQSENLSTFRKKIFSRKKDDTNNQQLPASTAGSINSINTNYSEYMEALSSETKNFPIIDMDYLQVFFSLCSILCLIYDKIRLDITDIMNKNKPVNTIFVELINKADNKIRKIIVTFTKELDGLVQDCIKRELELIDPLFISKKHGDAYANDSD